MKEAIKVWWYDEAPEELRKYSNHGGDEDYVILAEFESEFTAKMIAEKLSVCDYIKKEINYEGKKRFVFITAHA